MPETLLFIVGLIVTTIVGLAVWSVGLLDPDEASTRAIVGARDPRDENVR